MIYENKKRVALIFFGLIVAILIVEGLLRILGWGFHYVQDRQSRESVLSNYVHLDQAEDIQLNRAERKEFVVICLGESTTAIAPRFEFAFAGKNSWPRQLQRILNTLQGQKTFRVINLGVPGTTTHDIAQNLPEYLNEYRPDVVLAMVGINDFFHSPESPYYLFQEKTPSSQFRWETLMSHFRIYGLIKWIAGGIRGRVTGQTEDMTTSNAVVEGGDSGKVIYGLRKPNVTDLHPYTIHNLNNMVNLTVNEGIDFVFVSYALRKIDILKNIIERKRNVFYVSNYEIFVDLLTRHNYNDLFTDAFANDFGHATPLGNRIIADNVARQLLTFIELQKHTD